MSSRAVSLSAVSAAMLVPSLLPSAADGSLCRYSCSVPRPPSMRVQSPPYCHPYIDHSEATAASLKNTPCALAGVRGGISSAELTLPAPPPLLLRLPDDDTDNSAERASSSGSDRSISPVAHPATPLHTRRDTAAPSLYEEEYRQSDEVSQTSCYQEADRGDEERRGSASFHSFSSPSPSALPLPELLSFSSSQPVVSSLPSISRPPSPSASPSAPSPTRVQSAATDGGCVSLPTASLLGGACVSAPCPAFVSSARRGTLFLSRRRSERSIAVDGPSPPAQPTQPTSQLWHSAHTISVDTHSYERHNTCSAGQTAVVATAPSASHSPLSLAHCTAPIGSPVVRSSFDLTTSSPLRSRRNRQSLASLWSSPANENCNPHTQTVASGSATAAVTPAEDVPAADTVDAATLPPRVPPVDEPAACVSVARRSSEADLLWDACLPAPSASLSVRSSSVVLRSSPTCHPLTERGHRARRRAHLRIDWSWLQSNASASCESAVRPDTELSATWQLTAEPPPLLCSEGRAQTVPLVSTVAVPVAQCRISTSAARQATQPLSPPHCLSPISHCVTQRDRAMSGAVDCGDSEVEKENDEAAALVERSELAHRGMCAHGADRTGSTFTAPKADGCQWMRRPPLPHRAANVAAATLYEPT